MEFFFLLVVYFFIKNVTAKCWNHKNEIAQFFIELTIVTLKSHPAFIIFLEQIFFDLFLILLIKLCVKGSFPVRLSCYLFKTDLLLPFSEMTKRSLQLYSGSLCLKFVFWVGTFGGKDRILWIRWRKVLKKTYYGANGSQSSI